MKRFFFLAIVFTVLSFGSISTVVAQSGGQNGSLSEQQVYVCLSGAADVLGITVAQAEAMYDQGEIILEDQGSTTAVKTAAASGGGNTLLILDNSF